MSDSQKNEASLGLGEEFTANKADRSEALVGRTLTLEVGPRADIVAITFSDPQNAQMNSSATAEPSTVEYEALEVADDLYLIAISPNEATDNGAVTLVADIRSGAAMQVVNKIAINPKPGDPQIAQTVTGAFIRGGNLPGAAFERTSALAGRRAMWVYSENDVYEHIYLNDEYYAWHCLAGEEFPLADVDPCRIYSIRDGIFALTFSEKVLAMGATMVLDFTKLQSYCAAFGSDSGGEPQHFTFGAHGRILSETTYPSPLTAS